MICADRTRIRYALAVLEGVGEIPAQHDMMCCCYDDRAANCPACTAAKVRLAIGKLQKALEAAP